MQEKRQVFQEKKSFLENPVIVDIVKKPFFLAVDFSYYFLPFSKSGDRVTTQMT